jgi:tetratricopeptide (TPR) repeat protein
LKLAPGSAETHNNLGKSYFAQQKLDLAAKEFHTALGLDPRHRDANYNLGLVLLNQGHPEQAIIFFQRVQPSNAATLLNLTQAYLRAGHTGKGLELASKISGQNKKDVQLHFSLGVLLASEKQYAAAQEEFELADSLRPRTFEILHNLGQAYLRNHSPAKAEAAFERALSLKPDSAETMYLLAQAYSSQQKEAQALELLVRARKLSPANARHFPKIRHRHLTPSNASSITSASGLRCPHKRKQSLTSESCS